VGEWSIGEMILTGGNRSTCRRTCPSARLYIASLIRTSMVSWSCFV